MKMVSWRSTSQEEINELWKRMAATIEEEIRIVGNIQSGGQQREAYRGRSEPSEWCFENGVEIVGQEFSRGSVMISRSEIIFSFFFARTVTSTR